MVPTPKRKLSKAEKRYKTWVHNPAKYKVQTKRASRSRYQAKQFDKLGDEWRTQPMSHALYQHVRTKVTLPGAKRPNYSLTKEQFKKLHSEVYNKQVWNMGAAASKVQRAVRKHQYNKREKAMEQKADQDARYYLRSTVARNSSEAVKGTTRRFPSGREKLRYGTTEAKKAVKRIHKFVADTSVRADYKRAKMEKQKDNHALEWIANNPYKGC